MDNNYLYIVGFLGILLVCFVVFYFLRNKNTTDESVSKETPECDGDKCFIKQDTYEKCDSQY